MNSTRTSLEERLLKEDMFVRTLIDTIPPKIYFAEDINERLEEEKHAYIDANVKGFGKRGKKLNIRGKHKRARLDPFLQKTVSQIQDDMMEKLSSGTAKKQLGGKSENPLKLREKLSKKIDALKANRLGPREPNQKNMKRRNKRSKKNVQWKAANNKTERNGMSKNNEIPRVKSPKTETPIFNKEGKLVYSKFDFMDTGKPAGVERKPSAKKFKKVLDKLSQEKNELTALSAQDPEKAENLSKKRKWQTALNKSEGIKVKDNPEMLKRSLKRREQKKKKSQKQWTARNEKVEKGKEDKQAKRMKNIHARKQAKIDKKIKLSRRKGRGVTGF